jgi:transcriptional regulator with XRE-family HTH domain
MDDIREILATNLKTLMTMSENCKSQNSLAKRSGVAQTTIGNYLNKTYVGYPNLEKVEMLARSFGLEAWHLLHPTMGNKQLSEVEIRAYMRWRDDMKQILKTQ